MVQSGLSLPAALTHIWISDSAIPCVLISCSWKLMQKRLCLLKSTTEATGYVTSKQKPTILTCLSTPTCPSQKAQCSHSRQRLATKLLTYTKMIFLPLTTFLPPTKFRLGLPLSTTTHISFIAHFLECGRATASIIFLPAGAAKIPCHLGIIVKTLQNGLQ